MKKFNFWPRYAFDVYFGQITFLVAGIFLLWLCQIFTHSQGMILVVMFSFAGSMLFFYIFITSFKYYPWMIVLRSNDISVRKLFFPNSIYTYHDITLLAFDKSCIEFGDENISFKNMINFRKLLDAIIDRMDELDIAIKVDLDLEAEYGTSDKDY